MSDRATRKQLEDAGRAFFSSPRFAAALATAIVGTTFLTLLLQDTIGEPGFIAILVGLMLLAGLSFASRWGTIEWRGLLPISLLTFLLWSGLSIVWSQYQWSTLGGLAYQFVFATLGLYVALTRDLIQIVRTFGDVLRIILGTSLVLEVLSGILIDTPIKFLGIAGNLDVGGPIQGVEGTRNRLGLVALLALVTFGTELLTKSVGRGIAIGSLVGAGLTIVFSQSPVNLGALLILGIASLALLGLRRISAESRRYWQVGLVTTTVIALVVGYGFRSSIIGLLNGANDLEYRLGIWRNLSVFIRLHNLEGWGWSGSWPQNLPPFIAVDPPAGHLYSALNAYFDVWFQLGLVGLFAFLVFAALAIGRSWILAAQQRSRVYVWPALVLVALLATSLAESFVLVDLGWLTLVICAVKAAQKLSWRGALPD